jgi:hypothetical protein|tara:strand:+ start:1278 stop:3239 length:1962 start_codon:yes stop_codon:yes gene_type:complete
MATLESVNNQQEAIKVFNELKADGSRLLREGKIDAKTYYAKTRESGIKLGLIGVNDYPGRLPKWVEPTLEVIGGIGGTIGGAIVGGPPGAVAGAFTGSATGSLATDFLGDLLAPDMPSPTAKQRVTDAAITGTIDAGLTAAIPVVGRTISPAIRKIIQGGQKVSDKVKSAIPSSDKGIGLVEKGLGITDDAVQKAKILGGEGIELSLGQASSNPLMQGSYNLTSRMPIVGNPGRKQLQQVFSQVNKALDRRISPSAKVKPLTESERSDLIKEVGMENFNTWRKSYNKIYKKADSLNKAKGEFFDMTPLANTANRVTSPSKFTDAPKEIVDLLDELKLNKSNKIAFNDVKALDTKFTDLSKKYDPAKADVPNNYAFRTTNALLDTMKKQLRNPSDQAGRLYSAGDKMFKQFMQKVENKTGKEFQKALGRGSLRPGIGRPPSQRLEDLYSKTFGQNKSPEAVKELRTLIGDDNVNKLAGSYLDDLFKKYIKLDGGDFNKLFDELGLSNPQSLKYEATEELLKTYKHTDIKDLSNFLGALKQFPEVLPDVNTFIMRSGALRAASNIGPGVIVGATGAGTGIAGLGLLYSVNKFLSIPFNKKLVKDATLSNKSKAKELINRFKEFLPKSMQTLPEGLTPGMLAVQPAVPVVEGLLSE